METYTYQEEVEYEYKILNVLLKNNEHIDDTMPTT